VDQLGPRHGAGILLPGGFPAFPAVNVDSIAKNDNILWYEIVLDTVSKGPVFAIDECVRVVESHKNTPGAEVWLYIRELEDG
jgi:hypothetical protein